MSNFGKTSGLVPEGPPSDLFKKFGVIFSSKHNSKDIYSFLPVINCIENVIFAGMNHPKNFTIPTDAFSFWKIIQGIDFLADFFNNFSSGVFGVVFFDI